ncbi:MAG TPA: acetate/propionate family kinase [Candidatus Uhrbacteria bacterium]|nr:acetate/propionate family kinase [Candidatus Uhrbacteria bacterium]
MQKKYILVINAGSATLKFKIFEAADLKLVREGIVERIGLMNSFIKIGETKEIYEVESHEQAFKLVLSKIEDLQQDIVLVGHRVVHGGEEFSQPVLITKKIFNKLQKYNKLAPLHNPVNLSCIKASNKYLKNTPDVAVFDTAFYQTLPPYAYIYAIPLKYYQRNKIRRYGFHGISHQYMAEKAALSLKKPLDKLNLITCHLGSGCSISAIKKGKAVDTSMGFTPLEGLVMSTRSGTIDPAIPLYLMRKFKMKEDEVNDLLNKRSGLFGLCGSMDMREILVKSGYNVPGFELKGRLAKREKEIGKLTLDIFIYKIKKHIGAYAYILGSVDALVFSGGIGERSQIIRRLVLKDLPKIKTLVISANEELMIAVQAKKIISQ